MTAAPDADGWPFLRWLDDPQEFETLDPADPFSLNIPPAPTPPPAPLPPMPRPDSTTLVSSLAASSIKPEPSLLAHALAPPPAVVATPTLLPPPPPPPAPLSSDATAAAEALLLAARSAASDAKLALRRSLKADLARRASAGLSAAQRGKLRSRREAAVSRQNKLEYASQLEGLVRTLVAENLALRRKAGA